MRRALCLAVISFIVMSGCSTYSKVAPEALDALNPQDSAIVFAASNLDRSIVRTDQVELRHGPPLWRLRATLRDDYSVREQEELQRLVTFCHEQSANIRGFDKETEHGPTVFRKADNVVIPNTEAPYWVCETPERPLFLFGLERNRTYDQKRVHVLEWPDNTPTETVLAGLTSIGIETPEAAAQARARREELARIEQEKREAEAQRLIESRRKRREMRERVTGPVYRMLSLELRNAPIGTEVCEVEIKPNTSSVSAMSADNLHFRFQPRGYLEAHNEDRMKVLSLPGQGGQSMFWTDYEGWSVCDPDGVDVRR